MSGFLFVSCDKLGQARRLVPPHPIEANRLGDAPQMATRARKLIQVARLAIRRLVSRRSHSTVRAAALRTSDNFSSESAPSPPASSTSRMITSRYLRAHGLRPSASTNSARELTRPLSHAFVTRERAVGLSAPNWAICVIRLPRCYPIKICRKKFSYNIVNLRQSQTERLFADQMISPQQLRERPAARASECSAKQNSASELVCCVAFSDSLPFDREQDDSLSPLCPSPPLARLRALAASGCAVWRIVNAKRDCLRVRSWTSMREGN